MSQKPEKTEKLEEIGKEYIKMMSKSENSEFQKEQESIIAQKNGIHRR